MLSDKAFENRVIIVDDDRFFLGALYEGLSAKGFLVTDVYGDPLETLEKLADFGGLGRVVMLTDLKMREMDGLELIELAQRLAKGMGMPFRAGIMSNHPDAKILCGETPFISKQVGLQGIQAFVENLLS